MKLTCGYADCVGCYLCDRKEKRDIEFPPLNPIVPEKRQKKQAQLTCASADCKSCHICILKSRRSRPSNKNQNKESGTTEKDPPSPIVPGKSFAAALIASSSKKKESMTEPDVANSVDQQSNTSQTSPNKDSTKNCRVIYRLDGEVPLDNTKKKKE